MTQPGLFIGTGELHKPKPVQLERQRLTAAADRVLAALRTGPKTNVQLCHPSVGGLRGVGRVHDLRTAGYDIRKAHQHGGIWLYTLQEHS